ncbi:bilirubin oxidase [Actinotalea ferrariae CF5-4]|uniref:Bilirubin oxidase n=1 Tax=Actinotalea ferrariae CF5-4 TaxID=948458 RepID=A0A021VNX5_9CELL|nr:multicopper oxidase family protein [Actinotalea ferrariae]EYR62859.1 bilirubin oxidase [Actinotalea ferrariae CF5-4]
MERRDVLKLGALGILGVGALATPLGERAMSKSASYLSARDFPRPYGQPFRRPAVLRPYERTVDEAGPLVKYSVTAQQAAAAVLTRLSTPVWTYNGVLPSPTIRVADGERVSLRVRNALPATHPQFGHPFAMATHLHGNASLPQYDGYASDLSLPGQVKEYRYSCVQGARTMWYHDHAAHTTAQNVYSGLVGQFHVRDAWDEAQLPQGEFDVPLLLSDAMFAADGSLAYDDDDHSGLYGDVVLVNGVPWPVMRVKRRVYRFRVVAGSISRSWRLSLSTREAMTIVATDAGMLRVPQPVGSFRQGSGERYEILVDFRRYAPGTAVDLLNASNKNNVNYDHTNKVMRFLVTDEAFDGANNAVPTALDVHPHADAVMALTPQMARRTTRMRLKHDDITNAWSINDHTWADVVSSGYQRVIADPDVDDVEIWEVENSSGGWFHPVHIHLVDFAVLWRNSTRDRRPFAWERGPKDTVYVGEGETVRLLMRFSVPEGSPGGRYMIHCHNLPHEDHDMMAQFRVGKVPFDADPNHPVLAAPAAWDGGPPDSPTYEPGFPVGA